MKQYPRITRLLAARESEMNPEHWYSAIPRHIGEEGLENVRRRVQDVVTNNPESDSVDVDRFLIGHTFRFRHDMRRRNPQLFYPITKES